MTATANTETCVRSMYLRPSGDVSEQNSILVLDTDLKIDGHECKDMRLGDLLVSLEDMIEMARTGHHDVESVEIMCIPGKSVEFAYKPMGA